MIADSFTRTPDIDLSANLKNANRNFTTQIEHSVNYGKNKRPAVFNIRLEIKCLKRLLRIFQTFKVKRRILIYCSRK